MRRLGTTVAAAVLAVAATVLPALPVAPATAAACTDAGGVTVVVDRGGLGGGVAQTCVAGSGNAADLFAQAGHSLERVQRFPGAVCRVDGAPASAGCVNMPPSDAYWGLFWSNGTSGTWTYASQGVDGLDIPAGGSVAFAWQGSTTRRNPAVAPPDHDGSEPDGDGTGGTGGSGGGSGGGSTGGSTGGSGGSTGGATGGNGSDEGTPSASPSDSPSASGSASPRGRARDRDRGADTKPSDRPRDDESETPEPTDDATVRPGAEGDDVAAAPADSMADGGLPLWLVGLAALGLLAAGTVGAVVRRRATGTGGA